MADIRINALATTAASTASDDFVAVDGSANGTRKLNAYSPTFGGNLTVTGTSALGDATGGVFYQASLNSNNQGTGVRLLNNNAGSRNWYIGSQNNVGNAVEITPSTANNGTTFSTPVWQISSAGNVTQTGNLTVSGTGGITSSSVSPLLKATTSALGAVPKLTLENTNLGAWNVYLSGTDGGDFKIDQDSTNKFRIAFGTGNFLIGTAIDGGQKLQVAGTIKTTTGVEVGNGFGVTGTNGSVGVFPNGNQLTAKSFSDMLFQVHDGSAYTTQLTLGSGASPNATFAGTVTAKETISVTNKSGGYAVFLADQNNQNSYSYLELKNTGGTAQTWQLVVAGSGVAGLGQNIYFYDATANAARLSINTAGALKLHAYGAGTLSTDAAGNVTASSDARLKTNLRTFARGLVDVLKLAPKTYNWNKTSGMDTDNDYVGFVAQDVQSAIPEAVYEGKDANKTLTLNDRAILAALVNAVKELNAKLV